MSSKLPHAKAFKRWVLKDVLPTIRRTGAYSAQPALKEKEDGEPPAPAISSEPATNTQQWEARRARLDALASCHALARDAGIQLGEGHMRAIRDAVNEVTLPLGWQQAEMVDAAEILKRKGHSPTEISRLASELGRALKTAWERTERMHPEAVATNLHEFGSGSNDVRMYNAHSDAAFIDAVYRVFQRRDLYKRVCPEHDRIQSDTAQSVEEALQNSRG